MPRRVVVSVALLVLCALAAPAEAWLATLPGSPPDARPFGVGVDANGNVFTAGRTPSGGGTSDGIVTKLGALDGLRAWQRLAVGNASGNDILRALLMDPSGNPIVIGQITNLGTAADALIAKLSSSDGAALWRREIDGGTRGSDDARGGAVLAGGDVIATGLSPVSGNPDPIAVWRFAADTGDTVWTQHLAGAGGSGQRVAVDGGAIFVASQVPIGDATRITVTRLDAASGAVVWSEPLIASGNIGDEVTGLAVSSASYVVLSAQLHGGATAPDFTVVALAADTGDEAWRVTLDGTATGAADADVARGIAIDGTGQIFATGVLSNTASEDDLMTVKLRASDGHELWRSQALGTQPGSEDARDVAVNAAGDVIVAGRLRNVDTNGDLAAVKYAGATGALVWQQSIDGVEHGSDTAFNLAIDTAGNVAVAGRLRNGPTADGYGVVRLSGASGGSLPCGNGVTEGGEACDDGNPTAGDGCRNDCTIEVCGDGRLDPQEECDDANTVPDDCCSSTCGLAADDTDCDDGDVCTAPDHCVQGACVGVAAVVCPLGNSCEISRCDQASGGCVLEVRDDGTRCDDGNECTIADRCGDGVCIGGPPPFCDDDDPCTTDACEAAVGCIHPAVVGFTSVLCVFERRTIPFECRNPLPEPLAKRLERTELLLNLASAEPEAGPARRTLKRAGRMARKAQHFATRWRDNGLLPFHCGQAIVDEMIFLRARVSELRADLG